MGRAACHMGNEVTWEDMMKARFQFCDRLEELDYGSEVPVKPDATGHFEVPRPGTWDELSATPGAAVS